MDVLALTLVALLARVTSAAVLPQSHPRVTGSSMVPACRPDADCRPAASTPQEFFYEVNGEQVIMSFLDERYLKVWCDSGMFAADGAAPAADARALPALPRAAAVDRAELSGCRLPAASYAVALAALNVSAAGALDLTVNENDAPLRRHHFADLTVKSLVINGVNLSTEEDFLNDVKGLQSLQLYGVRLTEKARRNLPVTLTKLILNDAHGATPLSSLRWLERLQSLRVLTLIEESEGEPLTPPLLGRFPNLTDVLLQLPLTIPPLWLNGSALKSLSLNACSLRDLPADMFHAVNLTSLSMTGNNLTSLPPGLITSQRWLRALDVSRGGLGAAALSRLVGALGRLAELRASHNPLGSLCDDADYAYKARSVLPRSLRRLELRGTRATRVCSDWVDEHKALEYIDLSHNSIDTLHYVNLDMQRTPRRFDDEVKLILTDNPVRDILVAPEDEAACSEHSRRTDPDPDVIIGAPVRVWLSALRCDCSNARLRSLLAACPRVRLAPAPCQPPPAPPAPQHFLDYQPEQLLCECPADYNFNISGCSCGKRLQDNATVVACSAAARVAPGARWPPSSARSPLALDAAGAGLGAVPRAALAELRAADNAITALRAEDITDTLLVLDLRNNSIEHVSAEAARRLGAPARGGRARRVWLAGNPLACRCRDRAGLEALRGAAVRAAVRDWPRLRCRDGRALDALVPADLCPNPSVPAISGGAALLVALALATPLALRWARPRLKRFLFDRQLCLGWVLRAHDAPDDPQKTHDVFISYAYADRELAMAVRRRLERHGYSTVEHSRDWEAGVAVGEHIARSVACARRTLLLVSDSFAASAWGLQEFRAAHAHALRRGAARLLPVRCRLAAPRALPPDLRLYLRDNTYLCYDDPAFWDKLLRAMPPLRGPAPAPAPGAPGAAPRAAGTAPGAAGAEPEAAGAAPGAAGAEPGAAGAAPGAAGAEPGAAGAAPGAAGAEPGAAGAAPGAAGAAEGARAEPPATR